MDALVQELKLNDLPQGTYQQIASSIGLDAFCKLAEMVGGSTIYIPKLDSLVRPVRDVHIREEFNGYNHAELAQKYGVTVRWIRELCGSGHMEGQYDLFGDCGGE